MIKFTLTALSVEEECDDLSGNAKGACRKEAKARYVAARANAKVAAKAGYVQP
jgi:hypothetical protein